MTTKVRQPKQPTKPATKTIVTLKHTGLHTSTGIQGGIGRNKYDTSLGHIR
jgi:hypothetical protein